MSWLLDLGGWSGLAKNFCVAMCLHNRLTTTPVGLETRQGLETWCADDWYGGSLESKNRATV